jgi:hypothetical protein
MSAITQVLSLNVGDLIGIGINSGIVFAGIIYLTPIFEKWFKGGPGISTMLIELLAIAVSLYFARILSAVLVPNLVGSR